MNLTSTAFPNNGTIPSKYTCDGENISPPLEWDEVPHGTKSFVLIMDDPDAPGGTWDHWIVFNIPASVNELSEDSRRFSGDTKIGLNSWGRNDYGGPCPPTGAHRYFFKLYALDTILNLSSGASKASVEKAMKAYILDESSLMGRYERG